MVKIIECQYKSQGKNYSIVVSHFNEFITKRLLDGCLEELFACGVKKSDVTVVWVSGSLEIPVTALKLARRKNIDCVICLGAVIRGETIHFDLVAKGVADGVLHVSLLTGKPIIFGILTTDTDKQAYQRSDKKGSHKGRDAAKAAIEMVNVLRKI